MMMMIIIIMHYSAAAGVRCAKNYRYVALRNHHGSSPRCPLFRIASPSIPVTPYTLISTFLIVFFLSLFVASGVDVFLGYFNNEAYHSPAVTTNVIDNVLTQYVLGDSHNISVINHPLPRSDSNRIEEEWNTNLVLSFILSYNVSFGMAFLAGTFIGESIYESFCILIACCELFLIVDVYFHLLDVKFHPIIIAHG